MPEQNVEVELRRNSQLSAIREHRVHEARAVQNAVPCFRVREEFHQIHRVALGSGEGLDDVIEICGGEAFPTISFDHRDCEISTGCAMRVMTQEMPILFKGIYAVALARGWPDA